MTPIADPDGTAIYAGAPDGRIVKLAAATGKVLWSTSITRDPTHEKLTSSLNRSRGLVVAATGGYIGDAPPYQGHVVTLEPCDRSHRARLELALLGPARDHPALDLLRERLGDLGALWCRGRPGLRPAARRHRQRTVRREDELGRQRRRALAGRGGDGGSLDPPNADELERSDADLGSTAPALLGGGYLVQGGKDGLLRLLTRRLRLVQTVPTPGATDLFSAPATWQGTWLYVASGSGTDAWRLRGGKLHKAWSNGHDGTSPVLAGGLLYVQGSGVIRVYRPTTGRVVAELPCGAVHWQSPIVDGGHVIAAEGNANDHRTSGTLDIYG